MNGEIEGLKAEVLDWDNLHPSIQAEVKSHKAGSVFLVLSDGTGAPLIFDEITSKKQLERMQAEFPMLEITTQNIPE